MSKSGSKPGRSLSVERSSAIHSRSTSSPQEKSGRPRSKSATRAVLNQNRVVITTTGEDTLTKQADFGYSLSAYEDGLQEAPADDPDALDKQSKRRSRRETAINAPKAIETESKLPPHQGGGREARDDPDYIWESRSRRETANIVVVRPLPTSGHLIYGVDDDVLKSRSRRETNTPTPIAVMTGSDDEDDMRSRRSSISGVSIASGKKSALRKTCRSHSSDRHVSYSNTDIVYRSVCFFVNRYR